MAHERDQREVREAREQLAREIGRLTPDDFLQIINRARARKDQLEPLERAHADADVPLRGSADITGKAANGIRVKTGSVRKKQITFGSSGVLAEVKSKKPFASVTLRFKLPEKNIRHLERGTILVARWDEDGERFRVIPQSGYNDKGGYAFARISRPGIYTAVGLPRDPRIRMTLELARALGDWPTVDPKPGLNPKICGLILCNAPFQKALNADPGKFGFSADDFVGGPMGGNICDLCLGIGDFGFLPEGDIGHAIGGGGGPFQLAPNWPVPCPEWTSYGPDNVPGRIRVLAFDPVDSDTQYAGSAAGGVFKSVDDGVSWSTNWFRELSLAIGGLAVAPSNRDVIYAATGEWDISVSAIYTMYPGVGVYRSSDGGKHWKLLAPIASTETAAVAIDPTNPDRVFVAGMRGLHRSTNGGNSWDIPTGNTYSVFDGVVSDVVIDPNNANRIYIGVHHSAAKTGGVYRSIDGGNTWTLLTNGISSGAAADGPKIALGRNGAHGTQFVAVKMGTLVFTSINGGSSFTQQPTNPLFVADGRYKNVIAVDPTDEMVLFGADLELFRSQDGGSTWINVGAGTTRRTNVHDDIHAVVFDPTNHKNVFVATDGGIYKSFDNGKNWEATHGAGGIPADPFVSNGLVTLQCWTVAVSQEPRFALAVTSHDNFSYALNSGNTFVWLDYQNHTEGGWVEYDPKNNDVIYVDTWVFNMMKTTNGTAWWQQQVWTDLGIDTSNLNKVGLAIAWNNTQFLLAVGQLNGVLARSANGGSNWATVLSVPNEEISAVRFAPSDDNHAYAASTAGRVWHSMNGGLTWTELARVGLPNARVHDIEVDWNDPLRVYLAFGTRGALGSVGYRQLWRGEIGSGNQATWFDISGGLPALSLPDLGLTGLVLDPTLEDTIYVSNIVGVYRSTDGGDSWAPFDDGLPNTFISDLEIRKRDRLLFASTMGRGVFGRPL